MFEHRTDPLLPTHRFLWRVLGFLGLSAVVVGTALGIGVLGYLFLGGLPWIGALVNASMILGGMGPVDPITNHAGKLEGPTGKRTTGRGDNTGRRGGKSGERAMTGQGEPLRVACTTAIQGTHERPCEPSLCLRWEW